MFKDEKGFIRFVGTLHRRSNFEFTVWVNVDAHWFIRQIKSRKI